MRRFRDLLRALGFAVWPDQRLTPGTTAWTSQLDQRLSDSAVILLFLSKYTTESKWVGYALDHARRTETPVLPLLIDGDPGHVLLVQVTGDSWFDLRWSRNYRREIGELVETLQQFSKPVMIK